MKYVVVTKSHHLSIGASVCLSIMLLPRGARERKKNSHLNCIRAQGSTLGQVIIMISGLGAHGRLHSLLWLDVLEDLEGALDIHQRPAQQKGGIETSTLACLRQLILVGR